MTGHGHGRRVRVTVTVTVTVMVACFQCVAAATVSLQLPAYMCARNLYSGALLDLQIEREANNFINFTAIQLPTYITNTYMYNTH